MTLIKAQVLNRVYLFGPFVTEEEKEQMKARIQDAWAHPYIEEVPVNDPQEALGVAEGFTPVTPRRPGYIRRNPR